MTRVPIHKPDTPTVSADNWSGLRALTTARLALGRSGSSLPTQAHLSFQTAHALARDAVLAPLDRETLMAGIVHEGWPALEVESQAADRATYLTRPDLGRRLSPQSSGRIAGLPSGVDVALLVGDGLSSAAIHANGLPTLRALIPLLQAQGLSLSPIIVASQARVALADPIGELLQASLSIILIGERPGLSASDSLGLYLTWMPRLGRTDAERNCISNVRDQGLLPEAAARQASALVASMRQYRLAGVALGKALQAPLLK